MIIGVVTSRLFAISIGVELSCEINVLELESLKLSVQTASFISISGNIQLIVDKELLKSKAESSVIKDGGLFIIC